MNIYHGLMENIAEFKNYTFLHLLRSETPIFYYFQLSKTATKSVLILHLVLQLGQVACLVNQFSTHPI